MAVKIAIVGRPNVGKSTLFNYLSRTRNALVADQPGVTRDRHYGFTEYLNRRFILIDTGGLFDINEAGESISAIVSEQSFLAIAESDAVFWLVDGRQGLTSIDEELAVKLRTLGKQIYLLVNKTEGMDEHTITAEFHALGSGKPLPISALRGNGISTVMESVMTDFPAEDPTIEDYPDGLRICLIGRPNVGKSTLTNRILGENRMLTFEQPGTTRDSISIPFQRRDKHYLLVDTAGVRRRSRIDNKIEKFSVLKTLESLDRTQIAVLVLDASEGLTEQDLTILGLTAESGKSLIIAVNKWDNLETGQRRKVRAQLDRKLGFADYACIHYISALHGTGVGKLFDSIEKIRRSQEIKVKSSRITEILHDAITAHQPPVIQGRRIKLRYAHLGGHNPFRIIIHGNQTEKIPASYQRYLSNTFRKMLKLTGTPVLIEFRSGENPFKGKKNVLTSRQKARRRRLMKHVKKK